MAKQYAQQNNVNLIGQLTRDMEIYGEETKVARNTLACNRYIGDNAPDSVQTADFIPLKKFGKNLDWMKNFKKGTRVVVAGRMESGSYTDGEGKKHYEVYLNIENIEEVVSKSRNDGDEFANIPDGDDGLPFK